MGPVRCRVAAALGRIVYSDFDACGSAHAPKFSKSALRAGATRGRYARRYARRYAPGGYAAGKWVGEWFDKYSRVGVVDAAARGAGDTW